MCSMVMYVPPSNIKKIADRIYRDGDSFYYMHNHYDSDAAAEMHHRHDMVNVENTLQSLKERLAELTEHLNKCKTSSWPRAGGLLSSEEAAKEIEKSIAHCHKEINYQETNMAIVTEKANKHRDKVVDRYKQEYILIESVDDIYCGDYKRSDIDKDGRVVLSSALCDIRVRIGADTIEMTINDHDMSVKHVCSLTKPISNRGLYAIMKRQEASVLTAARSIMREKEHDAWIKRWYQWKTNI